MKKFNVFLIALFLSVTAILTIEIFGRLVNGTGISSAEWNEYLLVWLSFLFGIAFINAVDFVVVSLGSSNRKS